MTDSPARSAAQLAQSLARTTALVGRVHHGDRGVSGLPGAPLLVPTKLYGEAALLFRAAEGLDPVRDAREALGEALCTALADPAGLWRSVLRPAERHDQLFPRLLVPGPWSVAATELAAGTTSPETAAVSDRLEHAWLTAVARAHPTAPSSVRALLLASRLEETDLLHGQLATAYVFTHGLLHGTDQGRWAVAGSAAADRWAGVARGLLGAALLTDNDDIAAELLWTWPLLGLPLDPGADWVRARLGERFAAFGFLPGPSYDATVEAALEESTRDAYRSQTSYHTTLVWGLTCAALLRRGESGPPGAGGRADPLALLAGLPGRWTADLAASPLPEREDMASLALAAALRHAAAGADLAGTRRLVEWAVDEGLEREPVVAHAARWLRSAVAFSRGHGVSPAARPLPSARAPHAVGGAAALAAR